MACRVLLVEQCSRACWYLCSAVDAHAHTQVLISLSQVLQINLSGLHEYRRMQPSAPAKSVLACDYTPDIVVIGLHCSIADQTAHQGIAVIPHVIMTVQLRAQ